MSEDDLHTQRAARKGIDVSRASPGFSFMSRRGEGNGGPELKKKRVRRSPASFARQNSRARLRYIVRKP